LIEDELQQEATVSSSKKNLGIGRTKRSGFEIMRDIILIAKSPVGYSTAWRLSNQEYPRWLGFLNQLFDLGLLEMVEFEGKKNALHATEKGLEFVDALNRALSYLGPGKTEV
jgi:predicted transcriptional regulator